MGDRSKSGQFQKGHKGFRDKGIPNNKTKAWNELKEHLLNRHTNRFNEILEDLQDQQFVNVYMQILEYFKPKLQRTKIESDNRNYEMIDISKLSDKALKEIAKQIDERSSKPE